MLADVLLTPHDIPTNYYITQMFAHSTKMTNEDLRHKSVHLFYIDHLQMSLGISPMTFTQYYNITLVFGFLLLYYPF
jgi:hypothetical protein